MNIFVISYSTFIGFDIELQNYFFNSKSEAIKSYISIRDSVGFGQTVVQLMELNSDLTYQIIDSFQGTDEDLVEEDYDPSEDENMMETL